MMTTEEKFRELYGYEDTANVSIFEKLSSKLFKCFIPNKHSVIKLLPILEWLPRYKWKSMILSDIIVGLTIGFMQIPQGMAYSMLAGVQPVYGLYTAFFPVLIYTFLGTSRHISMGSYALTSLMIGATLQKHVPKPNVQPAISNDTNSSNSLDSFYLQRIQYATVITFFVGIILIVLSIFRLGLITRLFSRPMQSGFIFGAAFLTIVSQLKSLFGAETGSYSGPLSFVYVIGDVVKSIASSDKKSIWITRASVVTSVICILFLVIVRFLNRKYKSKFPLKIPIPGEVIVVLVGTIVSGTTNLEKNYHVPIVGDIPGGLPSPSLPEVSLISTLFVDALLVAIVGYSVAVTLAASFAEKDGYKIKPNQELLAIGVSNFFGSFFSCIPGFTAMSRSCVQYESGGKTQLVGWISSVILLFVLLFLGPLFQYTPKACLGSIVVVAVSGLLGNICDVKRYWSNHKFDSIVWIVTALATIFLDVIYGLAAGIGCALLSALFKSSFVRLLPLQRVDTTQVYRKAGLYKKGLFESDNIVVFQFNGPLNFLNCTTLHKSLIEKSGIDSQADEKQSKQEDTKCCARRESDPSNEGSMNCDDDEMNSMNSRQQKIEYLILDCSGISSYDFDGISVMTKVVLDFKEAGVTLLLSSCSDELLNCLQSNLHCNVTEMAFPDVFQAVSHAQCETSSLAL